MNRRQLIAEYRRVNAQHCANLCELVADGMTVAQAAKAMGLSESMTYRLWAQVRSEMGEP